MVVFNTYFSKSDNKVVLDINDNNFLYSLWLDNNEFQNLCSELKKLIAIEKELKNIQKVE